MVLQNINEYYIYRLQILSHPQLAQLKMAGDDALTSTTRMEEESSSREGAVRLPAEESIQWSVLVNPVARNIPFWMDGWMYHTNIIHQHAVICCILNYINAICIEMHGIQWIVGYARSCPLLCHWFCFWRGKVIEKLEDQRPSLGFIRFIVFDPQVKQPWEKCAHISPTNGLTMVYLCLLGFFQICDGVDVASCRSMSKLFA